MPSGRTLLAALLLSALAAVVQAEEAARFRFNDEAVQQAELRDGTQVLTVPPLTGIGRARIYLVEGDWPRRLILRTRVAALEGFGQDTPYADVERRRDGEYLELTIPAAWYAERPKFLRITWVDYFR